ncbi:hypothetical protein [Sutcliffiella rhizosphaerae]|nr:hypothetical protein [Sutcliffiella rhizosphaerae]
MKLDAGKEHDSNDYNEYLLKFVKATKFAKTAYTYLLGKRAV